MKFFHILIFGFVLGLLLHVDGHSNTSTQSTGDKRPKNAKPSKLKRREIIDYLDPSKPILFGGSYNLVSEWTGKKDPLNSDQSFVYRHNTDLRTKKRKREGHQNSLKPQGSFKIGKTSKSGSLTNNEKDPKKHHKKGKAVDNLNRKDKNNGVKEEEYRSPWSYNSWNGGMFRKAARCVDIPSNMSLCKGVGYDRMRVPNLLDHDSELEAVSQSSYWVPLWSSKCHRDTRIFLCSMFAPVCMEQPIYPCKSLCEAVKTSCVERMNRHGFPWPDFLECDQFPDDTQLCIGLREDQELGIGDKCSVCSQMDSKENIIDSFCNAEFVAKITLERTETTKGELKLISNVKKKIYKKLLDSGRKQLTMTKEWIIQDYSQCNCPVITGLRNNKFRQPQSSDNLDKQKLQQTPTTSTTTSSERKKPSRENQFLIMGRKKGHRMVLSFVQPIKRGPSDLNKALKMLTNDNKKICSTMSG